MYCGQCGTRNNEEAGTCASCGAPLLISAGARNCVNCGGSLGDADLYCPSCGAEAPDQDVQTYDATDSFDSIDIDDIELDELPEWLRDMAGPATAGAESGAAGAGQPSPEDLPAWLRDSDGEAGAGSTVSSSSPSPSSGIQHQPAEQFSLVGDDDLPDWLKALSEEDDDAPASATTPRPQATESAPSDSRALATLFDVPPVNRAWLPQGRSPDPSQVAAARQEFEALSVVFGQPESQPLLADARPASSIDWEQTTEDDGSEAAEGGGSRLSVGSERVGRMVKLAILTVLILVLLFLLFVLYQQLT